MNKIGVFIKDTFLKITKSMSFISMLLSPLVVILIIVGIGYFAEQTFSGMSEVDLAVISEDQSIATILEESEESITIAEDIETEEAASDALAEETIDGYLVANWEGDQLNASITQASGLDNHLPLIEQALTTTQTLSRAAEYGVSPEQIQGLNEPVLIENNIVSIEDGNITEEDGLANAIEIGGAYFINIFIMMFIMFYAATVIEEIAGEKGTRMMEVILSSTTATTHFSGN
jgi:ABC-2 type transport system permease protein